MNVTGEQNPLSSPSPTTTTHEATTNHSLPKDYKKVVRSLIYRHDISLDVKIDLWKRFAEYEACVDEENYANDEEKPAFTATSVGEIGPDVEMPVPWMESVTRDGSDNGEGEYIGENSDSGYGGNGSNSVDGVEEAGGEERMDVEAFMEGEENSNAAGHAVREGIDITIDKDGGQRGGNDDSRNGNENRSGSLDSTAPDPGAASTCISNQEPTTTSTTDNTQQPDLPPHPTTRATPPTPSPLPRPVTTFAQCRLDIRNYISDLAERERLLAAREKWVTSRAEALWRNAKVLSGMLKREGEGKGRKRVMREFAGVNESEEGRGRKRVRRV